MTIRAHTDTEDNLFSWREKDTYGAKLARDFLHPLEEAKRLHGRASQELQRTILLRLQWYFATDMQERAPTVIVDESMAVKFHELIRRLMEYIDVDTISSLHTDTISPEVIHALLSYKGLNCHTPITFEVCDHEQCLIRLSYYLHGNKPSEEFFIDEQRVEPAFSKYRGCRFFRRMLMRQRIVWLPSGTGQNLSVLLDGKPVGISLSQPSLLAGDAARSNIGKDILGLARTTYPAGKGSGKPPLCSFRGLKTRVVRSLARNPLIRKKYFNAWVFSDRDINADDSAEHLYRWVRRHHPEINIWFVLNRSSADWARLSNEGFKIISPGLLLDVVLLYAENVISTHTQYYNETSYKKLYEGQMSWRSIFLPHGISKDDVSHWLNRFSFDLFISTSPGEYNSIVQDDSPYIYTAKEVKLVGFPRHDRLLELDALTPFAKKDMITVMPTWRAGLSNYSRAFSDKGEYGNSIEKSGYIEHWKRFLNSQELYEITVRYRKKIFFIPHINAVEFLDYFSIPEYIDIAEANHGFQSILSRSIALITDYTSVAFEFALMRRQTFYYQFDRTNFYGGDHNWREGYFDYDRDGFGPISFKHDHLIEEIRLFLKNGSQPEPKYLARMEHAMTERDGQSCRRVFESIRDIRKPFRTTLV
jgi:CDP-glycerol glycerophosphotransferase (TagB/SpsB family)